MKQMTRRWLAAVLAAVVTLSDCSAGYAAETDLSVSETADAQTEDSDAEFFEETEGEGNSGFYPKTEETPYVLFELEEEREAFGKQFRLSDGTILAARYGTDIHFQEDTGKWKEIDNRFLYEKAQDDRDFDGFSSVEGNVVYKFAPKAADGEILNLTDGEYSVGFGMISSEPTVIYEESEKNEEIKEIEQNLQDTASSITFLKGEILNTEEIPKDLHTESVSPVLEKSENLWADISDVIPDTENAELLESIKADKAVTSVGYENVFPGVSLQYVLNGSSLKEYLLVSEKQETYDYYFSLNLKNLEPEKKSDGSIILKDPKDQTAIYEIPAGYMTDAVGETSNSVEMEIKEIEDGYLLKVSADREWINDEKRSFPVQIDPTLTYILSSLENIRGSYVAEGTPTTAYVQPKNLMVGYEPGNAQMRIYMQLRNFPELPQGSVLCGAAFYLCILNYKEAGCSSLQILEKEVNTKTTWDQKFTWNSQPSVSSTILDYRAVSLAHARSYVGWNITELVKKHYQAGNLPEQVTAFALEAYDAENMNAYYRGKTQMRLIGSLEYPVLQILYRDTKGIEGYFTYQTQDIGNAGVAYIGDYNSQLTLVKPVAAYESTIQSCEINLVYNSSYADRYFTADGADLHTKDFSTGKYGIGWKLSLQETVTEISLSGWNESEVWLVYNDSDGTEHYFKQSSDNSAVYKDEDGLKLTIKKSGSDYIMDMMEPIIACAMSLMPKQNRECPMNTEKVLQDIGWDITMNM